LFCLDRDGLLRWCRALARDYPSFTNQIGLAASPVLHKDTLLLAMENVGESLALGIDRGTGQNRWKVSRPGEPNWVTPFIWQHRGQAEAVFPSGQGLSAYVPDTGRALWSYPAADLSKIPSPVAANDALFFPSREELLAVRRSTGSSRPQATWQSKKLKATTASPLCHGGRVYAVNSVGVLACAEAATGKLLWQERIQGPFSASPVLAGNKLYLVNESGLATIVEVGDRPRVLGTSDLGEAVLASPAVADRALFLRTDQHLFRIAQPTSK
jgi:outer membrane protein assembly factor BamB